MEEEDLEVAIKAVVVGNGAVGKSSMIQRYCNGVFTNDYKKTIGVDFLEKQLEVDTEQVTLMVWDTAGQEEFDAITKAYYRGAEVCVLAFSTVDRLSFEAIESWKAKVEAECDPVAMVIVQNKVDLIDDSKVSAEEVEALAKRLRLKLFRTSVKMNFNVDQVFEYLIKKYLDKKKQQTHKIETEQPSSLAAFFGGNTQTNSDQNSSSSNLQEKSFKINPSNSSKSRAKKKTLCSIL